MPLYLEGKVIVKKLKFAKNFFERLIGLMFKKNVDYALIFYLQKESRINAAIHTMFMFMQIDVLFLNDKKRIVDIKQKMKPWSFYIPKRKAKYIVEIPSGIIKNFPKLMQKMSWR